MIVAWLVILRRSCHKEFAILDKQLVYHVEQVRNRGEAGGARAPPPPPPPENFWKRKKKQINN